MLEVHFKYVHNHFKRLIDRNTEWGGHFTRDLEQVDVGEMFVEKHYGVRAQHAANLFWIASTDYIVFEGFESPEEAQEVLEFIRNTEVLFL